MVNLKESSSLVVGASSGVGRATLLALAAQGGRVWGVARDRDRIEQIARDTPGEVKAIAQDASHPDAAAHLLRETNPDLVVVCAGTRPHLAPMDEHTWETFSAAWNADVKLTFHICQEALRQPLRPGSMVIILSSGAAIGGSPLSGGYAGAKRMQWFMAGYMQRLSDARKLGIRFVALVPKQLLAGTEVGETAARAYANQAGITPDKLMERFGAPLTAEGVADAILKVARSEPGTEGAALGVTGKGIEALP